MAQQSTGYGASYPTTYGYGQDLSAGQYQMPSGYSDHAAPPAPAAGGYSTDNTYGTSNYNMAAFGSGYTQEQQPVPKYQPIGSYGAIGEPLKPTTVSGYDAGQFASPPQEPSWQGYSDYSSYTTPYDTSVGSYDTHTGYDNFSAQDSYTQANVAPSYPSDGSGPGFSSNRGSRPPRGGPGRGGMQQGRGSGGFDGTDGYNRGGPGRGMRGGSRGQLGAMRGTGRGQYDVGGESMGRGQFNGSRGRGKFGGRGRGQFDGGSSGRGQFYGGRGGNRGSSRGRGQGDVSNRGRGGNMGRGQFDGGNRGRGQFGSRGRGRGFGLEENKSFGQAGARGRGQGGFRGRGQGGPQGRGQDGVFGQGQRGGMRGRGQQEGTRGRGQVDRGRGRGNGSTTSGQPAQYGVKIKKPFKMSSESSGFISYKNNLQEYCQKNHKPVPQYTSQKADIGFTATVEADGAMYSCVQSQREKKDAEQCAAFEALKAMGFIDQNEMFSPRLGSGKAKKRMQEDASSEPDTKIVKLEEPLPIPTQSCKSKLNEACMKMRCDLPTYSTIREYGGFLSTIVLNGQVYQGEQVFGQKKLAEQHVAEIVLSKLEGGMIKLENTTNAVLDTSDANADLSNTAIDSSTPKPAPKAKAMKNILQEYCQKNGMQIPIYNTIKDAGMCIATVTVNGVDYVGTPHIMKKTAEQNAAKKVVEQLGLK